MSTTPSVPERAGRRGHRKVAAVLAGGLVLGVGTMATLASWNDSEFASATFTAGRFDLESSIDNGATYSTHSWSNGTLTFTAPQTNMSPGDVVNAAFPVRLAAGTTSNARLRLNSISYNGGEVTGLTLTVWQNTSADCNATYNPAAMVATWGEAPGWTTGIQPTLTKGATAAVPGAPVFLCLKMTAGPTLPQGQVAWESWQFTATSE